MNNDQNTVIIPIHSFVDVITNSSSEIFVSASDSTVKSIKELVTTLILAYDPTSKVTAGDLFTFELKYKCYDSGYNEVYMTEDEVKAKRAELDEIEENVDGKYTEDEQYDAECWELPDQMEYSTTSVIVSARHPNNEHAKKVAEVLSNLTDLFHIDSRYN